MNNECGVFQRSAVPPRTTTPLLPSVSATPFLCLCHYLSPCTLLARPSALTQCFTLGTTTLGVRCGPQPVNFSMTVVAVQAPLSLNVSEAGEVCGNEWVYHYYDVNATDAGKHPSST